VPFAAAATARMHEFVLWCLLLRLNLEVDDSAVSPQSRLRNARLDNQLSRSRHRQGGSPCSATRAARPTRTTLLVLRHLLVRLVHVLRTALQASHMIDHGYISNPVVWERPKYHNRSGTESLGCQFLGLIVQGLIVTTSITSRFILDFTSANILLLTDKSCKFR
jgi:hypothetical protein